MALKKQHRAFPADLRRAQQQFASWRESRSGRTRIPESLWMLAVKMASQHGLSRTSMVLKVGYYSLKKRVERSSGPAKPESPTFIELPPASHATPECVIECFADQTCHVRIQLRGYSAADVVSVSRSLAKDT
jgi:hypothetical protein